MFEEVDAFLAIVILIVFANPAALVYEPTTTFINDIQLSATTCFSLASSCFAVSLTNVLK